MSNTVINVYTHTHTHRSPNFCCSIFTISNILRRYIVCAMILYRVESHHFETIDNWLAFQSYHMGDWMSVRARKHINASTYTYIFKNEYTQFYVHSYAFFYGCWVIITFTFKFEWKISEVSNLLSSLDWQWTGRCERSVMFLWTMILTVHFRFRFQKVQPIRKMCIRSLRIEIKWA